MWWMRGPLRRFGTSHALCAGHSKWQNIKHTKARNDAKRSTLNTKIAHKIYVAAREGGGPDMARNVRLLTAVEAALRQNITKKVIEASIARATKASSGSGDNAQSITYEGIGPGGVAFIVEAVTENKNRTAQQIRAAFLKYKGALSPTLYMFERRGYIQIEPEKDGFEDVFEKVIDIAGVTDIQESQESDELKRITILVEPAALGKSAEQVKKLYKIADMGLRYDAEDSQAINESNMDEEVRVKVDKLLSDLDDLEDVSSVSTNLI